MKRPLFFFLFILFSFQLQAQSDQDNGFEKLGELLDTDSLKISHPVDTVHQKVDTYESKFQDLKDSLNPKIHLPDTLLPKNPLDTISQNLEASLQKVDAVDDSLRQKLQVKVPDSLKNLLPKETGLLPNVEVPELEIKTLEELEGINEIEQLKSLQEIKDINNIGDIDGLPEMEQLNTVTDQVKEVKEIVPKTENIGETVEGEAKNLKDIKALEEQKSALGDAPQGFGQMQDQEHYKEELMNTAKEKAVDHFADHADKLQAAQTKLADIKRKYPEGVASIKDLPKKRPNPIKGKSFKERLILGMTIQIHPDQTPNVDLSPFAAYKISQRLTVGLGGGYRLMTKDHFKGLTHEGAVYGYRGFTEFMLHKGFFVHGEYELLKTVVRDSIMIAVSENVLEKEWIDGLLLGIGKEYKIAGLVKGNMQVLYNFLNEPNSPYKDKVMVRFGFSFQLKDKIKKPDLTPGTEEVKTKGKDWLKAFKKKNVESISIE